MAVKRTVYILLVLGAVVALVVANNSVALYLLLCLLVLPQISLVMLLVARKTVKFELEARESCIRGGTLQLTMRARVRPRFFVGGIKVVAAVENTTFHKTEFKSFVINDLSFAPHVFDYNGADSGRICVKCDHVRLIGIFGVFSIKVKYPVSAESIVSPVLYEDIFMRVGENGGDTVFGDTPLAKKGGDVTEIYNIRDYAAGDPPNAVHWKLSGKFGSLKSKEFGATDDRRALILVDMSRKKHDGVATDAQLNGVLDVAISVSNGLKNLDYAHSIGWFTDGVFESTEVCDSDTFVRAVGKLMSVKVNDGNEEDMFYLSRTSACAVFTKIIFVSTFVNYEEFAQVSGVDITAVVVGDGYGETNDRGVRVINIPCDKLSEALTSRNI